MSRFELPDLEHELREAFRAAGVEIAPVVLSALRLAFQAHAGQMREHRDPTAARTPYISHPVGVARLAVSLWATTRITDSLEDVTCACLTHDVIEDTSITVAELETATSRRAAELVVALTKPPITEKLTRSERNALFISQIIRSGKTACFIKLCDVMHNLAWPSTMPDGLLEKTIRRSSEEYIDLMTHVADQGPLKEAFDERIRRARDEWHSRRGAAAPPTVLTLDGALENAVASARSKVLEEHDVVGLVGKLCGNSVTFVGTNAEYLNLELRHLLRAGAKDLERHVLKALDSGVVRLSHPHFDQGKTATLTWTAALSAAIPGSGIEDESRRRLFLHIDAQSPAWLNSHTLHAIVETLTSRLRTKHARMRGELADEIVRLGLSLDSTLALAAGLTKESLLILREQVDSAKVLLPTLRSILDGVVADSGLGDTVDRIESRIKPLSSVAKKMVNRRLPSLAQLDDTLGIRVIVVSPSVREKLSDLIKQSLLYNGDFANGPFLVIADDVSSEEVRSDAGYRARHIRFRGKPLGARHCEVACEIQLRTLHEDAWARISQLTSYKRAGSLSAPRLIEELARLRDEADGLLDAAHRGHV